MSTPPSGSPDPLPASPSFTFGGYATERVGLVGVSFWPRVGARLIDYVVHYCATYAGGFLFSILVLAASGGHVPPWVLARYRNPGLLRFLPGLLGFVVYNVVCVSMHGSALGKAVALHGRGSEKRHALPDGGGHHSRIRLFYRRVFLWLDWISRDAKDLSGTTVRRPVGAHRSDQARGRDSGTTAG